jgi:hypothetical protein
MLCSNLWGVITGLIHQSYNRLVVLCYFITHQNRYLGKVKEAMEYLLLLLLSYGKIRISQNSQVDNYPLLVPVSRCSYIAHTVYFIVLDSQCTLP